MILKLTRFANGKDSTLGIMRIDDRFECFTLEDEYREQKVKGETRIPNGKYEVVFRETPSPLTTKYRNKFDWFNWHLMLKDVKNFDYVYIHVGNTDDHTDGCILVGYQGWKTPSDEYEVHRSTDAYRDLYAKVKSQLLIGEKVEIEISGF